LEVKVQTGKKPCCSAATKLLANRPNFARKSPSTHDEWRPKMIATKVGYLATGLAFFFVGAVAMGLL
jgi:hypothetical protein